MEQAGEQRVIIIGAGPAGLTAAYELGKAGIPAVVLERERQVGGLAKTINHEGFHFDIGGHRFYTKVAAAERVWREVLPGADFLRRKRLSRIYYDGKFFDYPLRAPSVVLRLGLWQGSLILLSYLRARLRPEPSELTFEQWVTNRFGRRLYQLFFKPYTEKVWGIPCSEITAEWAAQRIRGLSLTSLIRDFLFGQPGGGKGAVVKTLIDEFDYPRLGPGMMWEAMAELVRAQGGSVRSGASVEKIHWARGRVESVEVSGDDGVKALRGTHFISSMPMRELVAKLAPAPPDEVAAAAERLQYRDFLTVALVVNRRDLFPDNWIYIHEPGIKLGRVQNFKNWSPDMVPDPDKTCLGLEYFCFAGDGLWSMSDDDLIELGKRELAHLGLAAPAEVEGGTVVRVPRAYPVYDSTHKQSLRTLRRFFDGITNLQLVGRNGMHRYNNQDHSMLTAMLAVKNIQGESHDLWEVNAEGEYHEEVKLGGGAAGAGFPPARHGRGQPSAPERVKAPAAVQPSVEYET
jgi:protoporphyrinogen oxidase